MKQHTYTVYASCKLCLFLCEFFGCIVNPFIVKFCVRLWYPYFCRYPNFLVHCRIERSLLAKNHFDPFRRFNKTD